MSYAIALREVAGGCASTGVGMAVTNMTGEAIFRFGDDAQRRRSLPMLSGGKGAGAFALTEPGAGSDAGGLSTFAREDVDGFVLDGSKVFITNGAHACVDRHGADAEVAAEDQRIPGGARDPGVLHR